jgi:hypothetical protein
MGVLTLHDRNNDEVMVRIPIESEHLAQAGANIPTLISIVQELGCQPVQGITINADGEIQIRRPNDHPLTPKINGQSGRAADLVLAVVELGARIWSACKDADLDVRLLSASNSRLPEDDGQVQVGRYTRAQNISAAFIITFPIAAMWLDYANRPADPREMLEGLIEQMEVDQQPATVRAATATNRTN